MPVAVALPDFLSDPEKLAELSPDERQRLSRIYSAAIIQLNSVPIATANREHDELLEPAAAAQLVKMSVGRLRRWEDCPFVVVRGRRKFYSRNGIDRYIAERTR